MTTLVLGALGLDEKCTKNTDCSTISSICVDSKCTCDDLSYYNGTQCLQYATEYNAVCSENAQCEWLGSNSECRHNRCGCIDNFRWYKGKCQEYFDKGEICKSDDDCYNGYDLLSLTCSSKGVCNCRSDYYDRGNDCRKSSFILGECALNIDCRSSSFECVLGKCSIKTNRSLEEAYFDSEDIKIKTSINTVTYGQDESTCTNDDDCKNMANSVCDISNNKCGCNVDTHYLYNGNCVRGLTHCEDDDDCTDASNNTVCFKNSCICQPGFFLKDQKCVAELGMQDPYVSYQSDSDCPIKPGKLVDSVCYCKNYWFNDEPNQNCVKTMIQSTHSCLTNEWCAAMGPYSFCNSTSNTCQCSSIASFNESTYYCDLVSNDKDICLRDSECNINERCLDEKCECAEDFLRNSNNVCAPNIGASCALESCSHIENSYCTGGICTCASNYVGKETKCLKVADSLETPCEEQEQCQALSHAVCGESEFEYATSEYNNTLRCVCEEGYTDVNNMCYQIKKFGDPCMTEAECTMVLNRSYKCRNSQCQCGIGLSLKNGYCTSGSYITIPSYLIWLLVIARIGLW